MEKNIFWKIGEFFDKHLKWHSCEQGFHDGASYHGICKYCGAECLQDSQGNWFEIASRKEIENEISVDKTDESTIQCGGTDSNK